MVCENNVLHQELRNTLREADLLTKAWWSELLRIFDKEIRELWEEVLLEITIELEPTVHKQHHDLGSHDRELLRILQLLVLPGSDHPQRDRDQAVAMFARHGQSCRRTQ